ncbi:YncE family protein [Telmatobacter bradus]|uniref:YncE family protein n=1 Tax=Telmatobacter bradus TaxID=474953 RepID=UPI003B4324DF
MSLSRFLPLLALLFAGAVEAQQGDLLVVTKQSHALAIVDPVTLTRVGAIPIGEDPHEVVVAPDGRTAYVTNYQDASLDTIQRVDLVTQKQLEPVSIAPLRGAHGLFLHGNTLWFTAGGSNAIAALDTATNRVTTVLGTGQDNTHMVWVSQDGQRMAASNAGSGTMSLFVRDTLPAAQHGTTAGWKHTLLPDGLGAEGFAVAPDEKTLWAGNQDGVITVIDLESGKVVESFEAGVLGANRLKFTLDGKRVVVTTHKGKDLVVIDAATHAVVKRIPIEERGASGIQMEPGGKRVFIACPRDHIVAVVDLEKLERVATIDAGREPDGMTWWERGREQRTENSQ